MATLTSISNRAMCKILPLKPQFNRDSKWIETDLSLQTEISGQKLTLTPWRTPTIMSSDFTLFIEGVRDFVDRLKARPVDSDPLQSFSPFTFTPLELDFEFSCLDGEYDEDGDGEVAIRFMIGHLTADDSTAEQIGVTTEVDIKALLHFLDALQLELSNALGELLLVQENTALNGTKLAQHKNGTTVKALLAGM